MNRTNPFVLVRARVALFAAAVLIVLGRSAFAQTPPAPAPAPPDPHTVQPERPTVATHAGTVAPGYLEIETGIERDTRDGTTMSFAPTVLKFGVAPRVQMSVFTSIFHQS